MRGIGFLGISSAVLVLGACSSSSEDAQSGLGGAAGAGNSSAGGQSGASTGGSGGGGALPGDVGSSCATKDDCIAGYRCITEADGWPGGYCTSIDCEAGSCPSGSECFVTESNNTYCLHECTSIGDCSPGYACHPAGGCVPACTTNADCVSGQVCHPDKKLCTDPPCTADSCAAGLACDAASGKCVPDMGKGPGPGPGPDCSVQLPERDCAGTPAYCGEVLPFDPDDGPGYLDYPLNGETYTNQYRSFLRRDMQMLIKYASAYVACKAASWTTGNGGVIGLGDMSEANGDIPGTSVGSPGHPVGTHVDGYDIDIGYFQAGTADNKLRPICEHMTGNTDEYHCLTTPDKLDLWRNTLFLGSLFTSEIVRVIGVDGKVGPLVEQTMPALCATGWLPQRSCDVADGKHYATDNYGLAYETTDGGAGWYYFHHHHQHVSANGNIPTNPNAVFPELGQGNGLVPNRVFGALGDTRAPSRRGIRLGARVIGI